MTTSLSAGTTTFTADDQHRLYKRSLTVVVISQVFGGAGLAAGVMVGIYVGQGRLDPARHACRTGTGQRFQVAYERSPPQQRSVTRVRRGQVVGD